MTMGKLETLKDIVYIEKKITRQVKFYNINKW